MVLHQDEKDPNISFPAQVGLLSDSSIWASLSQPLKIKKHMEHMHGGQSIYMKRREIIYKATQKKRPIKNN